MDRWTTEPVSPRRAAVHPSSAENRLVKRSRRPPLQHPLAPVFARAVESLSTALSPGTECNYNIAVRNFLICLGAEHPGITGLEQLRRDPHILGWMSRMRAQTPPLATATCIGRLIALRALLNELAWAHKLAELTHLIRREDIDRTPQTLPRPLIAEQDHRLQQELMRRNDLAANVFLLLRHTGLRIGECVDLSYDCLRRDISGCLSGVNYSFRSTTTIIPDSCWDFLLSFPCRDAVVAGGTGA